MNWVLWLSAAALAALFFHDRWLSHDNILRNFPVIGHLRYLLIELGPELRQYIVSANREELPFNRAQFTAEDVEISSGPGIFKTLRELHGYTPARTWTEISGWS